MKTKDYHPKNYQELLAKYRKVSPKILEVESSKIDKRASIASGLEVYSGEWGDLQKAHFLKRILFGLIPEDLKALDGLSFEQSVELILSQGEVPSAPVNDYNDAGDGIEDPEIAYGETWINSAYGGDYEGPRTISLKNWLISNAVNQSVSLEEKMIFFWHNLLPIQTWGIFYSKLCYQYFDMLRTNCFGNFKTLIRELTLNPAMLLYLNGTYNNKEAPDENYGRELQELFCIGKGPNAGFTESDVQEAARVLTGWVVDWENFHASGELQVFFYPPFHEESDKQFSSFYGDRLIEGKTGSAGAEELDELLDMIFENDETALYICRRLYKFFVYNEIDATTEEQIIVPLAQTFRANNYEVLPVIRQLLLSAHFHDTANHGAMIKSPSEFLIGLWRTFGMGVETEDLKLLKDQHSSLLWQMANMGLELGDPPSVSGWPAYYQEPSFDKYWITTDTITNRALLGDSMVYWGYWINPDLQTPIDFIPFLKRLQNPEDPNLMLQECSLLILGIQLDETSLNNLKAILLSGQQTDSYWTIAWGEMIQNPGDQEYEMVVVNRLKPTFQHLLQLGEAQLM
ncbi:MAG: hypothetical protein CMB80_16350 [Flammeovirgaceae bacterium]|nr:hypothetical protein [Flammeovirgaceae bacterium]MBE63618.1 hypothetical protein [Flammeovirgaceae bacterium]MBR10188.1 hypothetical protein [Rickettsiales bacterium]HCX21369.1 hypothetical protein [Cytophagales bacterium]|tara:strand:- start:531 stop:2243 length:1713 start_codon:yes stop_codon:yes gene_type:complete